MRGAAPLVVVAMLAHACAQATPSSGALPAPPDLAVLDDSEAPPDATVADDLTVDAPGGPDLSPAMLGGPDLASSTGGDLAGGCAPRINEIVTGTTASPDEEWVELYNPCAAAVAVAGWKLGYRAATNTTPSTGTDGTSLVTIGVAHLAAHGFLVFAGKGYKGTNSDGALLSGLKDGAGAVGLRDAGGRLVDAVCYGTCAPGNAFVHGAPAPAPAVMASPGASIGRIPDGSASGDDAKDFAPTKHPTPRAANQ